MLIHWGHHTLGIAPMHSPKVVQLHLLILEGLERYFAVDGSYLGQVGANNKIRVLNAKHLEGSSKAYLKMVINRANSGSENSGVSDDLLYYGSNLMHNVSKEIQEKVAETIYKREIKGNFKSVTSEKGVDNGTSMETSNKSTDGGIFIIYPDATEDGEYLLDDYNNVVNSFIHEDKHSRQYSLGDVYGGSRIFSHIKIGISQMSHPSYKETTEAFKKYHTGVLEGYLDDQKGYLVDLLTQASGSKVDVYNSYQFQYYLKEFDQNVATYEEKTGQTYKDKRNSINAVK